jgi:branched-chain amino acid transport system substrate-binding protein
MQFALNTANKTINMSGGVNGRPVRLVTYDSAGIPRRGALYADRLINLDCASLIVGLYHDNVARAVIDEAARYHVPVIIAGARDETLASANAPNAFQIMPSNRSVDEQIVAFLETTFADAPEQFLHDDEHFISYVYANNKRDRVDALAIQRLLEMADIVVEPLPVDLPANDFSSDIARILASEKLPDAVVIDLPHEAALAFRKQLGDVGIGSATGTLLLLDGAGLNSSFTESFLTGAPTIVAWSGPWPSRANAQAEQFAADYEKYFDHWPDVAAFASYDALLLAVDAIRRADTLDGSQLIAALDAADVELAAGHYRFKPGASDAYREQETHLHQGRRVDPPVFFVQYPGSEPNLATGDILWP